MLIENLTQHLLFWPTIELVLLGILAGTVGVLSLVHEKIFFTEAMTHSTFPGAVLGVVIGSLVINDWWSGLYADAQHSLLSLFLFCGAGIACIPMAGLMYVLGRIRGISTQAAAGIVLTLGFALGYFLATWFQPLPLRIESFLTGSVLNVSQGDITAALVILLCVLCVLFFLGKQLIFYAFDRTGFCVVFGRRSALYMEALVLCVITLTIVVLIPAVGTILSLAIIVAPSAGLLPLVRSVRGLFVGSSIAGIAVGLLGMFLGVLWDLSVGGMIAVCAGVFYFFCRMVVFAKKKIVLQDGGSSPCE